MTAAESAVKEAPSPSQWRRVTAFAGIALATCLLAPIGLSCDARSVLTGELCAPVADSVSLRGRRLHGDGKDHDTEHAKEHDKH
eukprot:CAMPEP_0181440420 /NCGR_PEP_ID=MMETSP1110-20121109/22959_1 /TAXON_ID=174948 /ORGANISM="Symbiodinium sp., Strain CCMP421" /LENGTH=83 /DNA_ID=CAMNT_0023564225 /DNA_START=50 /DNA_END=298 /DNA_ORIENTATION=-